MQNSDSLKLEAPSLPGGGGAITGLKGDVAGAGPDGAATLSVPLPISAGRGYAPALALGYHSRAGNGPCGMGWDISLAAIRRRTNKGVPTYGPDDEFTGPDGEVLVPLLTDDGTPQVRSVTALPGIDSGGNYRVHAYRSRTESDFSRLEYWVADSDSAQAFWLLYRPDGQLLLLGRNTRARISNPDNPAQIAVWLAESSVSLTGEQIWYQYRAEDDSGCEAAEKAAHGAATAQRYLTAVWYGNRTASRTLPALVAVPEAGDWLFTLVLDYGERDTDPAQAPAWLLPGEGNWPCREDRFSSWEYGFELRTRRLCRQVLMYHALTALAGEEKAGDNPQLVARLWLDYQQTPSVTTLQAVRQLAYEADGRMRSLPPLAFGWHTFMPPPPQVAAWQQRDDMANLNPLQPYQLVDLHGEGLAGILYQDNGGWWYRAPVRQPGESTDGVADGVTWDRAAPLPVLPALHAGGALVDLNGDGYLEWLVTAPGLAGQYARTPDGQWRNFTPLAALPVEYAHPRAQLADITGAGLADLVLIGPKSVRLYSGSGDGWQQVQTVMQADNVTLPVPAADAAMLVAFSDIAGSGQQHLVQVSARGVRYWPNLGHGRFGAPLDVPGFSQPPERFNPQQLFLADIDGSGTTDLIYALSDRLLIYRNQSGNAFAAPFSLPLPDGARYDRTCSLQLADIQGLGVASLVLTTPHPLPRHWVCHLAAQKPWLLNAMDNHLGATHRLYYRSSAQFWLDEKADAAQAGKAPPACYLPFALHTLQRTEVRDDITGNRLVSSVRYRHGAWDGREREFRGFARVDVSDTDSTASQGSAAEISMPAITRSWYATGLPPVDEVLSSQYWQGDSDAFSGFVPRFTTGSGDDEQAYTPDERSAFWLNRGLKGLLLRSELYGADGSERAAVPYSVSESRPQVRLVEARGVYPVIWPAVAESRSYLYERVSSDPQCSQQVLLSSDQYGQPLRQVSISYPRRRQLAASPYPPTLPPTLFAGSYDPQQQLLRLALQHSSWYTLADSAAPLWLTGLPDAARSDIFIGSATDVPGGGLTLEQLAASGSLVGDDRPATFAGQQQAWYLDMQGEAVTAAPAFPPRLAFSESAVLDEDLVASLAQHISAETLTQAGYAQSAYLFARRGESGKTLWTARQGYSSYGPAEHFWLPESTRNTLLTGADIVTRDQYHCVITALRDAAGLTTRAQYDWRFLTPVSVTDANDNLHSVTLDALGRVTTLRFSGTENGSASGYSDRAIDLPQTAEQALALSAPLPVHQLWVYLTDSWMTQRAEKLPPHVVVLTTDRYDSDPQQQIRQQVVFSDGFGRVLQASVRQADGDAWQRTAAGALVSASGGAPQLATTSSRWAVSGRTEYDNKGQAIRTYQPFFLNSWQYLSDDSARQDLYADTHYYDPTGREWQVKTAKGWLRRSLFTPWFVVSEDENNTAAEAGIDG